MYHLGVAPSWFGQRPANHGDASAWIERRKDNYRQRIKKTSLRDNCIPLELDPELHQPIESCKFQGITYIRDASPKVLLIILRELVLATEADVEADRVKGSSTYVRQRPWQEEGISVSSGFQDFLVMRCNQRKTGLKPQVPRDFIAKCFFLFTEGEMPGRSQLQSITSCTPFKDQVKKKTTTLSTCLPWQEPKKDVIFKKEDAEYYHLVGAWAKEFFHHT